ncbi:MAG: hypothetical protein E7321_06730 [Clostridiales bacterium]|nr:hypothetical protein [Clostridiales bacterium]
MAAFSMALALLGGVIGAGFASGREILRFFGVHGAMAPAAVVAACLSLFAFFLRVSGKMRACGAASLTQLCRHQFGCRFGLFCGALFVLLCAVTGAAMLAACAELGALLLPVRHGYGLSLMFTLLLSAFLSLRALSGLALPGALLMLLTPYLLARLMMLPAGEACFLPAMTPDLPVRALCDGAAYGALSAAQLAGMLTLLAGQDRRTRLRAALLFSLLLGGLLVLGTAVCQRHMPAIVHQALPFVYLSRALGPPGYLLVALCMYAAALSTYLAMLRALLPAKPNIRSVLLASLVCLLLSQAGFDFIIAHGYPLLGALCAGLLLVLCMPVCPRADATAL